MKIQQHELQTPFISIRRNQQLTYFINLNQFINTQNIIREPLKKCKYCKAFSFCITLKSNSTINPKVCELCQSINDYQMVHNLCDNQDLTTTTTNNYFRDNSYKIESLSKNEKIVYLNVFIDLTLDFDYLSCCLQALKALVPHLEMKVIILVEIGGGLGVIDFHGEDGQLMILSEDIDVKLILEFGMLLKEEHIGWLYNNLSQLQLIRKKHIIGNINSCLQRLSFGLSQLNRYHHTVIIIWISKIPLQPYLLKVNSSIYTIGILLFDGKPSNSSALMHLSTKLNEVHLIDGKQYLYKVYYKLYEIINHQYLGNFCYSHCSVKTNVRYSGSIVHQPQQIIKKDSWLQLKTKRDQYHQLQVNFEYFNMRSSNMMVINLEELKDIKVCWFQKVMFISRVLQFILQQYNGQKTKNLMIQLDYAFINKQMEQYGSYFLNSSTFSQQILQHINNYFKDFQKNGNKIWLAFNLMFRKGLLFLMYPLWQGGVLHHYDGHWLSQSDNDNQEQYIEWSNQIVGVNYTPKESSLHIFYRLCLQNEEYCFIQFLEQAQQ